MPSLRVLVTNLVLTGFSGTEVAARDVAIGLARRGHQVALFALRLGIAAREDLHAAGVVATDDVGALPWAPDIIHGHHNLPVAVALLRFHGVPTIAFVHDPDASIDEPLVAAPIRHYVAIDELRQQRIAKAGIAPERISILRNAVDLERFAADLPEAPQRALAIIKHGKDYASCIAGACRTVGIPVDMIGPGVGREVANLHEVLARYSIVLASGRCAMEAIAMGRSVVVCDHRGLAGVATRENWTRLRAGNFGKPVLAGPLDEAAVAQAIRDCHAVEARALQAQARPELDLSLHLDRLEALYRGVLAQPAPAHATAADPDILRFAQSSMMRLYELTHDVEAARAALHDEITRTQRQIGSRSWLARQLGALMVQKLQRVTVRRR